MKLKQYEKRFECLLLKPQYVAKYTLFEYLMVHNSTAQKRIYCVYVVRRTHTNSPSGIIYIPLGNYTFTMMIFFFAFFLPFLPNGVYLLTFFVDRINTQEWKIFISLDHLTKHSQTNTGCTGKYTSWPEFSLFWKVENIKLTLITQKLKLKLNIWVAKNLSGSGRGVKEFIRWKFCSCVPH